MCAYFCYFNIFWPEFGLAFGLRASRALKKWVRASGFRARARPGAIPSCGSESSLCSLASSFGINPRIPRSPNLSAYTYELYIGSVVPSLENCIVLFVYTYVHTHSPIPNPAGVLFLTPWRPLFLTLRELLTYPMYPSHSE